MAFLTPLERVHKGKGFQAGTVLGSVRVGQGCLTLFLDLEIYLSTWRFSLKALQSTPHSTGTGLIEMLIC